MDAHTTISLDEVESWPNPILSALEASFSALCHGYGERERALRALETALRHVDVIGYHCTRLDAREIEHIILEGLKPLSADVVRARVTNNPCRDPEFVRQGIPRRRRSPKPQLTIEIAEKLLTHAELPEHWRVRILIGCTGGLRDGEIAGLQWQDVDLDAAVPVMRVRKAVALVGEKGTAELGRTKTEGSVRDVPVHPEASRAIRAWKARGWLEWVGRRPKPEDFLLPSEQGCQWRPRSAEMIRTLLLAAGLRGHLRRQEHRLPRPPPQLRDLAREGRGRAGDPQAALGAHRGGRDRGALHRARHGDALRGRLPHPAGPLREGQAHLVPRRQGGWRRG